MVGGSVSRSLVGVDPAYSMPSECCSLELELGQGSTSGSAVGSTHGGFVTMCVNGCGSCLVAGQAVLSLDCSRVGLELIQRASLSSMVRTKLCRPAFGGTNGCVSHQVPRCAGLLPD